MAENISGATLKYLDDNRVIRIRNVTCPFCGTDLGAVSSNEDHVIARRFVPKGTLKSSWNLVVRSCARCNGRKSALEDDISAITMHPDAFGRSAREDQVLRIEAERKAARSISRRTKKPVAESTEDLRLEAPFMGGKISFDLVAPPQLDDQRAFELARMQLAAFFYWITFDSKNNVGGFWPGGFYPVLTARCADWGNGILRGFADHVRTWEPRVLATAAEEYFRVTIRRHPEAATWSWALEWNAGFRLIGFFGDREPAQAVVDTLPALAAQDVPTSPTSGFRYRAEIPIAEDDDHLFSVDAEIDPRPQG